MILYIVRHGETDWNKEGKVQGHKDIPLNDYGRKLALQTAEGMREIPLDRIYTSPLARARETAQILKGDRRIPVVTEERIKEMCFGKYEGMSRTGEQEKKELDRFQKFFSDPGSYEPPEDGESVEELYRRTGSFLNELCQNKALEDERILISTHGAAMTALVNRVKGNLSVAQFWRDEVPPNCAVTVVEVTKGVPRLVEEGVIFYKEKVKKWKMV